MIRQTTDSLADLYLADETAWLDAMAELIGTERYHELDFAHIAEFLADNAARDRRDVHERLVGFLAGLLMWQRYYDKLTPSRRSEILDQQFELENWTDTPTLKRYAESIMPESYGDAVERASAEANVSPSTFPVACPWKLAELLSGEVLER